MSDWSDERLRELLKRTKTIAVVGASPKSERPSHYVSEYMQQQGYKIIPVNPGIKVFLGEPVRSNLAEVDEEIDLVDVFRSSEFVPALMEEAIHIRAKAVWLQLGINHPAGEERAREKGIEVVTGRCLMVEHRRLLKRT